jgi:hypothetical protein
LAARRRLPQEEPVPEPERQPEQEHEEPQQEQVRMQQQPPVELAQDEAAHQARRPRQPMAAQRSSGRLAQPPWAPIPP